MVFNILRHQVLSIQKVLENFCPTTTGPIKECFLLIPQGIHNRDQLLQSLDLFGSKVIPRFAN